MIGPLSVKISRRSANGQGTDEEKAGKLRTRIERRINVRVALFSLDCCVSSLRTVEPFC